MTLRLAFLLAVWALPALFTPALADAQDIRSSEVVTPPAMAIPAPPALKAVAPKGFTLGLGYGLSCAQAQPGGAMVLHSLTGRGPTLRGPSVAEAAGTAPSALFVLPDYTPAVVTLILSGARAEVTGVLPLAGEDGKPLRGLPPASRQPGAHVEIPLSLGLKPLAFDPTGMDPTGVVYDFKRGAYWIVDGYRPALARVSSGGGHVQALYVPGDGLEPYLGSKRPGGGFSGVSLSPTDKLYTIMRRPLAWEGKPGHFTRIVEFDPSSERVRQMPYLLEEDYADPESVTTGDPVAYADKRLLVLEQGLGKDGAPLVRVFSADLTRAHNIHTVRNEAGQPPEAVTDKAQWRALAINSARKTLVLDLKQAGFTGSWAESMTLLNDGRTLLFMSGHGFGVEPQIAGFATGSDGKPVLDPAAYTLNPDGSLVCEGRPVKTAFTLKPTWEVPRIWLVTLPKKATDY
ncbi:hypothetical protein NNJEOMEG_00962 [Fundidesulfovibrio magnetotacticus]|uniref:Phytase-like domain-containing protein n=1 Tax=Fundidesulfovibrio magnetotacticus TaxID=2730080 RepID=A0A6V8LK85_9BACT|nr:esterase-like activity of phytase family protein [Fundidesulfovibrio magnetotacticus]GFK93132.1 hypothetical protein NNJEOMEG_00962 [Fundidesulfovibrio magnetotacticus]